VLFISSSLFLKLLVKLKRVLSNFPFSPIFNLASASKASFCNLSFSSCNFLSSSIANKEELFLSLSTFAKNIFSAFNFLLFSASNLLASFSASFSAFVSFFAFTFVISFSLSIKFVFTNIFFFLSSKLAFSSIPNFLSSFSLFSANLLASSFCSFTSLLATDKELIIPLSLSAASACKLVDSTEPPKLVCVLDLIDCSSKTFSNS